MNQSLFTLLLTLIPVSVPELVLLHAPKRILSGSGTARLLL
jgi:hypothetical protein